jgi:hypothetical protein
MLLTSCTSNTNDKSYATPKVVNHFGEKAKELDRKCEDINQLNIANQLISAAKMIFELRTKGDNYGELSQYYYPKLFTPAPGNHLNTGKTLIKMKNGLSPKR